jgi:hypothetical protein
MTTIDLLATHPGGWMVLSSLLGSARVKAVGPCGGVVESGTGEVGALQLGALKVGIAQVGAAQIRTPQIRVLEMGPVEVGIAQPCPPQVCLTKVSVFQISALQPNSEQLGTGQIGVAEQNIGQSGVMQEGATQVDERQVQLQLIAGWWAPAQHAHGGLDISGAVLQPGQPPVNRWRRMHRPIWRTNQPGGMGADVGSENGLDGASIRWGVRGDAFQGVEPAKAHVLLVAAQLVDRAAESFGDLAFSADLELSPGRNRPHDQHQASDPLQQRGPNAVLQLRLALLQLDALFGTSDSLQFSGGQRWTQQLRKNQHAGQQQRSGRDRQHHRPGTRLLHPGSSLQAVTTLFTVGPFASLRRAILAFGLKWIDGHSVAGLCSGLMIGSHATAGWTLNLERSR